MVVPARCNCCTCGMWLMRFIDRSSVSTNTMLGRDPAAWGTWASGVGWVGVVDVELEQAVASTLSATSTAATLRRAIDTTRSSPTGEPCSNGGIGARSGDRENCFRVRVESVAGPFDVPMSRR